MLCLISYWFATRHPPPPPPVVFPSLSGSSSRLLLQMRPPPPTFYVLPITSFVICFHPAPSLLLPGPLPSPTSAPFFSALLARLDRLREANLFLTPIFCLRTSPDPLNLPTAPLSRLPPLRPSQKSPRFQRPTDMQPPALRWLSLFLPFAFVASPS